MDQNRLKSPVVWTSLAAQVLSLMVLLGVFDNGVSTAVNALVAGLLQLLVVLGVLNNPTDSTGF
ncbi:MAG: phage holin [Eubacteriales bacterium]|nr:phage holin [Eubacteriales bacterium]